jgi:acyl dehydratase
MSTLLSIKQPETLIGHKETSDWLTIDEEHLKAFAHASYLEADRIDLTPSRNHALGPELVDGFLLLSLLVYFDFASPLFRTEGGYGFNYGVDRVRFTQPVYVGQRVRLHRTVADIKQKTPTRMLATMDTELEVEGSDKPAMIARWLLMLVDGASEK